MNLSTFQRSLAALPARQLNLLAIGAIAIAAAMALTAIRAPLAKLRAQQVRLAALSATASTASSSGPGAALHSPAAAPKPAAAPTALALIAAVSAGARENGVTVARAAPGPEREVAGLRQQTLDVDAAGSYADLLRWIAAIEAKQPAVGIVRLELQATPEGMQRLARLRLGAYSAGSQP